MFGTTKAVRGIQGWFNAGSGGIALLAGNRRALKRSLHAVPPRDLPTRRESAEAASRRAHARFSTIGRAGPAAGAGAGAGAVAQKGRTLPGPEEIIHDRFLACVEREDANGSMAHFAFISCEGGALVTLRRRQLLVMLCEKGLVKEASELLTSATLSPSFDSQDLSTIASFMYVMCGCLRHGDVDRALMHFRQASERGIGLDLPLCEGLATALFIKGVRGEATEMEAWNVLDYIRQRGMEHGPEVCDHALLYATASDDLSFALRMCQYVDEEGIWCDPDVREALCRSVAVAIKKLPKTAAVTSEGGDGGDWKVEGTNATVEQLWALDSLLQRWLDTEMDEVDEHFLDVEEDEEESGEEEEGLVVDATEKEKGDGNDDVESFADVVDYDGDGTHAMNVDDVENAADVVDFNEDDDGDGGGQSLRCSGGPETEEQSQRAAPEVKESAVDFGGEEFCGDLMDQMSVLHPEHDTLSFEMGDEDRGSQTQGFRRGQEGARGVGRRAVYADLVMPYGDPHGEGEQGILSIPVKISVGHDDENDDDDDDDDDDA